MFAHRAESLILDFQIDGAALSCLPNQFSALELFSFYLTHPRAPPPKKKTVLPHPTKMSKPKTNPKNKRENSNKWPNSDVRADVRLTVSAIYDYHHTVVSHLESIFFFFFYFGI